METGFLERSFFSTLVHYSTVVWTIFCIVGTWFVILKFGILPKGLLAIGFTLFFATAVWSVPFLGLLLLSLCTDLPEDSHSAVTFQELIKTGLRRGSEGTEQGRAVEETWDE